MTDVEDRMLPVLAHRRFWKDLFVMAGLTAALSWAAVLAMVLIGGGTAAILALLAVPAAAAAWICVAQRRTRKRSASAGPELESAGKHLRPPRQPHAGPGRSAAVLAGFTALLCWFGGFAALGGSGNETFMVLTALPLVSTLVAAVAFRRWKNALLHRAP
ncbi:hypothetical protein ACQCSX_20605 [Pseudarthrobacter sp. P1]|uniref:hypothetical protein n=1 Tax=Pseudarthrobacter sp. P1 TaxID=3418418 RepID=UPI003CF82951